MHTPSAFQFTLRKVQLRIIRVFPHETRLDRFQDVCSIEEELDLAWSGQDLVRPICAQFEGEFLWTIWESCGWLGCLRWGGGIGTYSGGGGAMSVISSYVCLANMELMWLQWLLLVPLRWFEINK